jgi:hypothetical protein
MSIPPECPIGREPTQEFVSNLQAVEFRVGEVMFDGFLEDHNVYLVFAEVIF